MRELLECQLLKPTDSKSVLNKIPSRKGNQSISSRNKILIINSNTTITRKEFQRNRKMLEATVRSSYVGCDSFPKAEYYPGRLLRIFLGPKTGEVGSLQPIELLYSECDGKCMCLGTF